MLKPYYLRNMQHINNCGNYRAIKEIPLPFAFRDINKVATSTDEEGGIQLPLEPSEDITPVTSTTPNLSSVGQGIGGAAGSFYGRRDFENRQDLDDITAPNDAIRNLNRQPSIVGAVLERIKSRKQPNTVDSDTDIDDEDEDEEDDDSD